MKKTNRFIALLTAFVLVFSTMISSVAFAAVPTDVKGSDFEVAVGKLKAVGVMEGYPDGTFLPAGEITRAEFAKIAVVAYGLGDAAEASKGVTKFADVPSTHWAAGYINLAVNRGLITGYPDGTYKPEGKLTNAEAITILVRLIGLGPVVDKEGTWPANYVGRAANEGVLDGVNVASTSKATRGFVAKMLVNTLTVQLWGASGYKNDGSVEYGPLTVGTGNNERAQTLLEDKLDIAQTKDVRITTYDVEDNTLNNLDVKAGVDVNLYDAYLNEVTMWQNDDDEIIFVDITSDYFIDAIEMSDNTDDEVTLIGADKTYDLSSDLLADIAGYTEVDRGGAVAQVADTKYDLAKVVLDEDGDVLYIDAYTFDQFIVAKSSAKDTVTDIEDEEWDLEDYEIYKDGKLIVATDVVKDDILLLNTTDEFAEVYNKSVTGKIDTVFSDAFEVKNVEYEYGTGLVAGVLAMYLDGSDYLEFDQDAADKMQDEGDVTVFVDREGDPLYVTGKIGTATTNDVLGVLTQAANTDVNFGKGYLELVFVNAAGKKVTETIKLADLDKLTIEGREYEVDEINPDDAGLNADIDEFELNDGTGFITVEDEDDVAATDLYDVTNFAEGFLVQFTYNADGKVVGLEVFDSTTLTADFDTSEKSYVETYKMVTDSLIFDVTDGIDAGDTVITKWDDVKFDIKDNNAGYEDVYYNTDNEVVAIVTDLTDGDDDTTDVLGLLASFRENTDGDVTRLTAWVNGAEKTYTVDEETSALTTGVAYTLVVNDNSGVVEDVTTVAAGAVVTGTITAVSTSDKTITINGADAGTYKLVSGYSIVDITSAPDDGETMTLLELKNLGGAVTLYLDEADSLFVKLVVVE